MASENGEQSPAIITIIIIISIALTTRTLPSHAICSASSKYYVKSIFTRMARHTTKCGVGSICGADLNGDNLRIYRAYLRISDHRSVTVRVRVRITVLVRVRVSVADRCIQTAGESDKMRINHVIKTEKWRAAPHFVFVVSRMTLSGAHTSAKAADPAKFLLLSVNPSVHRVL